MRLSNFLLCSVCGRIVEEHVSGRGPLTCCGRIMTQLTPNSSGFPEDHTPRVYLENGEIIIEVGLVPHDMKDENRILWVEIAKDGSQRIREYLGSLSRPEASFRRLEGSFFIRVLCSKHGLWEYLYEPIKLEVSEAVSKAVDKYNSLRGEESSANIVYINNKTIKVEFTGSFCKTCGFYDYFEDFRQLLEEFGVKSSLISIDELEEGALVTYSI
ncbi:MAG: desulfoferrodoxin family protein [Candidatus Korarchaeum sp.]|nr:desulfoferrodoxin family protein [Candidatus Korarchaeum sp.]MDW8034879.1 desulfoferrodoxin family protein [Candidatus Korarchaeum sp.]